MMVAADPHVFKPSSPELCDASSGADSATGAPNCFSGCSGSRSYSRPQFDLPLVCSNNMLYERPLPSTPSTACSQQSAVSQRTNPSSSCSPPDGSAVLSSDTMCRLSVSESASAEREAFPSRRFSSHNDSGSDDAAQEFSRRGRRRRSSTWCVSDKQYCGLVWNAHTPRCFFEPSATAAEPPLRTPVSAHCTKTSPQHSPAAACDTTKPPRQNDDRFASADTAAPFHTVDQEPVHSGVSLTDCATAKRSSPQYSGTNVMWKDTGSVAPKSSFPPARLGTFLRLPCLPPPSVDDRERECPDSPSRPPGDEDRDVYSVLRFFARQIAFQHGRLVELESELYQLRSQSSDGSIQRCGSRPFKRSNDLSDALLLNSAAQVGECELKCTALPAFFGRQGHTLLDNQTVENKSTLSPFQQDHPLQRNDVHTITPKPHFKDETSRNYTPPPTEAQSKLCSRYLSSEDGSPKKNEQCYTSWSSFGSHDSASAPRTPYLSPGNAHRNRSSSFQLLAAPINSGHGFDVTDPDEESQKSDFSERSSRSRCTKNLGVAPFPINYKTTTPYCLDGNTRLSECLEGRLSSKDSVVVVSSTTLTKPSEATTNPVQTQENDHHDFDASSVVTPLRSLSVQQTNNSMYASSPLAMIPSRCLSAHRHAMGLPSGVWYDRVENRYVVQCNETTACGRKKRKYFGVSRYGEEFARRYAISARLHILASSNHVEDGTKVCCGEYQDGSRPSVTYSEESSVKTENCVHQTNDDLRINRRNTNVTKRVPRELENMAKHSRLSLFPVSNASYHLASSPPSKSPRPVILVPNQSGSPGCPSFNPSTLNRVNDAPAPGYNADDKRRQPWVITPSAVSPASMSSVTPTLNAAPGASAVVSHDPNGTDLPGSSVASQEDSELTPLLKLLEAACDQQPSGSLTLRPTADQSSTSDLQDGNTLREECPTGDVDELSALIDKVQDLLKVQQPADVSVHGPVVNDEPSHLLLPTRNDAQEINATRLDTTSSKDLLTTIAAMLLLDFDAAAVDRTCTSSQSLSSAQRTAVDLPLSPLATHKVASDVANVEKQLVASSSSVSTPFPEQKIRRTFPEDASLPSTEFRPLLIPVSKKPPSQNELDTARFHNGKQATTMLTLPDPVVKLRGVNWLSHSNVWRARWVDENGREVSRCFSVEKFGWEEAKALAIRTRQEAERQGKAFRNGQPVKHSPGSSRGDGRTSRCALAQPANGKRAKRQRIRCIPSAAETGENMLQIPKPVTIPHFPTLDSACKNEVVRSELLSYKESPFYPASQKPFSHPLP